MFVQKLPEPFLRSCRLNQAVLVNDILLSQVPVTSNHDLERFTCSGNEREVSTAQIWLGEEPRPLVEEPVFLSLPQISFSNCLCLILSSDLNNRRSGKPRIPHPVIRRTGCLIFGEPTNDSSEYVLIANGTSELCP